MQRLNYSRAGACLQAALDYHHRGLVVTLCRGKKPLGGMKWHEKRWTPKEIAQRFRSVPSTNVGTLLGPHSGLVDFEGDGPGADAVLLDLFDGNPRDTPTWQATLGKHRVFRWHPDLDALGVANMKIGDLEIRLGAGGKAAQSVLPPSRTDKATRTWLVSLDDCDPAEIPKSVVRRLLASRPTRSEAVSPDDTQRSHEISVYSAPSVYHPKDVIRATLPTHVGTRHRQVFEFARHLKATKLADADLEKLRPWVEEWHRLALPHIRTQDFTETWVDFCDGWGRVKFPAGLEPIAFIYRQAVEQEPPAAALRYPQAELRNLVSLCRQLQIVAGDGPFYLAGRTAARLIGVEHPQGARWLKLLVFDKVLALVHRGTRNRASEYRYIAADVRP
jgi:hypothetical protein